MKTHTKNRFLVPVSITVLGLILAGQVTAQTFTTVYSFSGYPSADLPTGRLLQGADGALYGTTSSGGSSDGGTVFKLNPYGTGLTVLLNFDSLLTVGGGRPSAGLIQGMDGALYGTTIFQGLSVGYGSAFKLNPDGTGFTVLQNFNYVTNGANPSGRLIQGKDGALYGTAISRTDAVGRFGTVFRLDPNGIDFAFLQHFDDTTTGAYPYADLMQAADGSFYGTTSSGGTSDFGTVFKLNADGTGFTVLQNFDGTTTGAYPAAGMIQGRDGALYGTTSSGGSSDSGTIFKLTVGDTESPVLSVPGTINVNATSPAGADVIFSVTALDVVDPNPTITCSPASGSTFPIGTTHVTCTATDASGNSSSSGFDVVVRGAGQQTTSLTSLVQTSNFPRSIERSLVTQLQQAQAAIVAARFKLACGNLEAFIIDVRLLQGGKKITIGQAHQLITAAKQIQDVVGCR